MHFLFKYIYRFSFPFLAASIMQERAAAQSSEAPEEIEEIVITSTRNRRSFEQQPTRVEVLGGEEINEKANMKPGDIRMMLNESTGIHVQQTSATSFNSNIRIQGLNGKYTQLLRDGLPMYGGFSSGLGLLQIAPLDLQQVEVIKGANSTLYGGGAIAGLVNLVTKKPEIEPETSMLLNATSAGGLDASGFHTSRQGSLGKRIFASYNKSDAYDSADNGFSAIPEFERWTLNPHLFIENSNSQFSLGFNAVKENRIGGDMDYIDGDRDSAAYFEKIATDRFSTQLEYISQLQSGNEFVIRNSVNHYKQNLKVPEHFFKGTQLSSFSEAHLLGSGELMEWVVGLNLWTEKFDQDILSSPLPLDFDTQTVGVFAQGTFYLSELWSVEGGLRFDSTSEYGSLFLPRVSLLYKPSARTTLRIGGGSGYKEPTLFGEESEVIQYRGILPLEMEQLVAEESTGFNVDLNQEFVLANGATLDINLLLFTTRVDNPLRLVDVGNKQFAYRQPDDFLETQGTELGVVWRWNDFKYFFGYTHADVKEHTKTGARMAPLMPKDRVNNVFVYEREDDFRIGLEAYYYGRQGLTDGSMARDFWIFGLMMEKRIDEDFSVFLNFENFSDTRQTRFDSIYTGSRLNPIFADIFAPLDGSVINGGVKIRL